MRLSNNSEENSTTPTQELQLSGDRDVSNQWHRFQAWRGLHPGRLAYITAGFFALLGVVALVFSFYFHFHDQAQIRSERAARLSAAESQQAASKAVSAQIDPVVCHLVWTYTHLPDATPNSEQVAVAWHGVGALVGCADGVKP
jgi:hypothetical protein